MKRSKRKKIPARVGQLLAFSGVAIVLMGSGLALAFSLPTARTELADNIKFPVSLRNEYGVLVQHVRQFENHQVRLHAQIVSDDDLQKVLSRAQLDAASGNFKQSKKDIAAAQSSLDNWNLELSGGSNASAESGLTSDAGMFLPVVLYHYTPPDFEQQLEHLEQNNYTVIDMETAVQGLAGGPLPAKPVVITFDDGFENQMDAFALLKQHHMKATFYIINGGAESNWCIGAGRRYNDPLQPPGGCGDSYLTWDQVRQLDRSGLITIGGHTLDHENLAGLTAPEQQHQIADSKSGIEQEIGHPIYDFAYPYGAYDDTTINLVREAGYDSAVTTLPSDYQAADSRYTLHRIRDTYELP